MRIALTQAQLERWMDFGAYIAEIHQSRRVRAGALPYLP
jgi:hypothetical protein